MKEALLHLVVFELLSCQLVSTAFLSAEGLYVILDFVLWLCKSNFMFVVPECIPMISCHRLLPLSLLFAASYVFTGVSQVVSALTSQLKPMSVAFVKEILILQKEQSIYHDGMLASVMLTDKCRCEPLWLG